MWEWTLINNNGSQNTDLLLNQADRLCIGFGLSLRETGLILLLLSLLF
jgi:hypothetical protein